MCKLSGAGISVQAGIPDFRSPEGLFQSLKRENPRDGLTSGKDLFDASVFSVSRY
jgi:NAD-dependent SIR2 family protein deacetylase